MPNFDPRSARSGPSRELQQLHLLQPKRHATLEWWRRLGLDAALDPDDDTVKWQPIIVCALLQGSALAVLLVLSLDVIPNGATEAWVAFGPLVVAAGTTCEWANERKMVRQVYTAMSAFGYLFVGLLVGLLTYYDLVLSSLRRKDRIPYCKGPNGNMHVKVTAVSQSSSSANTKLVSVDPEYLAGNTPALLRREPVWGAWFSLSLVFLGVTSFLFHASQTQIALLLKHTAWFAVCLALSVYSVVRAVADGASPRVNVCQACSSVLAVDCRVQCDAGKRAAVSRAGTYAAMAAGVALPVLAALFLDLTAPLVYVSFYSVAVAVFLLGLALHYFGRSQEVTTWFELGLLAALAFALGLLFVYYEPALCRSRGYFQPHALWQAVSAAGLGLVYFMLRSDAWAYDVLDGALEERRAEDAYRVPLFPNRTTSLQQSAPRQQPQPRPRTLDSSGVEYPSDSRRASRENSMTRLDQLRAQHQSAARLSRRSVQAPVAYWTCPDCAYEDNEMSQTSCERCGETRPPLDEFTAVEM